MDSEAQEYSKTYLRDGGEVVSGITVLSEVEKAVRLDKEKRKEQARISSVALASFAEENRRRAEEKKSRKLPSTVTSERDPRHGKGGVVVEDNTVRGFAISRPKNKNIAVTPSKTAADLSLGGRSTNPRRIEQTGSDEE